MTPLVLFHRQCPDGFCAAWIARRKFPDAEFVPVQYGEEPPDVKGRDVYVLDFSFSRQQLQGMMADSASFTLLDHHKTAEEALRGLTDGHIVFDMNKSGARLTWEHFFPNEQPPWIVDLTEDRDLWLWQRPYSREINAALSSYPQTFESWDELLTRVGHYLDPLHISTFSLVAEGRAILRYQEQLVERLCANAIEVEFAGYIVPCVNAPVLQSEVAGHLAAQRPFAIAWAAKDTGNVVYSLRSTKEGLDVSAIAKRWGGGGHRSASGAKVSMAEHVERIANGVSAKNL